MGLNMGAIRFAIIVFILQAIFTLNIGFFGKYAVGEDTTNLKGTNSYPTFQDVHIMIFVGFGALMSFLKRYSFSSLGVTFFIAIMSCQWSTIVRGHIHHGDEYEVGLGTLLTNDFSAATVLISMGVILGKSSATQLLVMAIFEVVLFQVNEYIGVDLLEVSDIGESIFIHMFGAYFGLAVSFILYNPEAENSPKEGSSYRSDVVAFLGSMFLWCYWPSFNGGGADEFQERAYVNTIFSLTACTAVTFALARALNSEGKFDMVYIQNATLAGGVAVGTTANMPLEPYLAMISGMAAGILSTLGYKYLTPYLNKRRLHDTCGVHNLHGMPAFVAAIVSFIMALVSGDWEDKERQKIFAATKSIGNETEGRSGAEQGGYQLLAVVITLGIAIVGGVLTGLIMKLPLWGGPKGDDLFEDEPYWELPEDETPSAAHSSYKQTHTDSRL